MRSWEHSAGCKPDDQLLLQGHVPFALAFPVAPLHLVAAWEPFVVAVEQVPALVESAHRDLVEPFAVDQPTVVEAVEQPPDVP